MEYPAYFAVVVHKDQYYLKADEPGCIQAWQTQRDALNHFENSFKKAHERGITWSTGACLFFLNFIPKIIEIKSQEELAHLFNNEMSADFVHLWGEGGGTHAALIVCDDIKDIYDAGISPELINEKWYH